MTHRPLFRRPRGEEGSAPIVGILVASAVVISAFAAAISITANEARTTKADAQELRSVATDALSVIVSEPGRSSAGLTAWVDDADALSRFGLASDRGKNFLDGEKISALRRAKITNTANTLPDYPEVRTALGLDGYDFHLRSYPIVYSIDDPRWSKFRGMHVAYIGNYEKKDATMPAVSVAVSHEVLDGPDSGTTVDHVLVHFDVTCTSAPQYGSGGKQDVMPDVFVLETQLKTGNGNSFTTITQNTHSPVIDCGPDPIAPTDVRITVRYEKIAWSTSAAQLKYNLKSSYVGSSVYNNMQTYSSFPKSEAGSEAHMLTAEMLGPNYVDSDPILRLDHFDKGGRPNTNVEVRVQVTAPDNTVTTYPTSTVPNNGFLDVTLTGLAKTTNPETFKVKVQSKDGSDWGHSAEAYTQFTYSTNALNAGTYIPTLEAERDIEILDKLVETFGGVPQATNTATGDVYRDDSEVTNELKKKLGTGAGRENLLNLGRDGAGTTYDKYDLLVIGSGVSGTSLNAIADEMYDWVQEGGTLLVIGTQTNQAQWLNSKFKVQQGAAGGAGNGLSAPDETHSALTAPEQLNWRSYDAEGRNYEWPNGQGFQETYDGFTHVIVSDENDQVDVLAISNPGTYGKGTVIITSFMPYTMTGDEKEQERFMNNMLTQSLHAMLIDYGPAIPSGVVVGSAQRLAVVPHPHDATLYVELRLVLYVWK